MQEDDATTHNQSHTQFSRRKKSNLKMRPIDQLREEIKGDARFKEMYDDLVKM